MSSKYDLSTNQRSSPISSPSPSSSTTTTPPSEATLAGDDVTISEAIPSQAWDPFISNHTHQEGCFSADTQTKQVGKHPKIDYDYESSSAEDVDSGPLGRYETAEFALLSYSRTNNLDKLQALLEAKAKDDIKLDLNFRGLQKQNFSWSAMHLACYFGHLKVAEALLSKKLFRDELNINIQNNSGDTPLHKATLTNRIQIVQLLLSNGANVSIKNCDGLVAKLLTTDEHIVDMLEAAEQADKNKLRRDMFKAVDNGDLERLREYFEDFESSAGTSSVDTNSNEIKDGTNNITELNQIVDERGNTLLHLAAMRGFKAICVYLLEKGFNPYKKNNLGQSCFDLSSYQLRQLFTSVKPSAHQLRKLSKQRVTRFEGPLLKKVRLLGWRQTYVVLENGVILLFNNRKDSMNKARRGYKYLESATCEPESNDLGMFSLCFSDRSKAIFLVTSDHLNSYTNYRSEFSKSSPTPGNQIELIRQKWIDSLKDHIAYSTLLIRGGLKLNEETDAEDSSDLIGMNRLLPVDTIKNFVQEARAHYSILERHAESLCNLVHSITSSSNRLSQSVEPTYAVDESNSPVDNQSVISSTTGGRLFGLIRTTRLNRSNQSGSGADSASIQSQHAQQRNTWSKAHNDSLTDEFIQDNWHCILFHLRLLTESAENTKTTMGQALALMEHQEHLRQNRLQEQEERCRVLEDSLHALARDHHELEKSMSMSQLYHSATARSMSLSTDLNEYHDAFEDFDDEKTVTPNSMPSDEELDRKIKEVLNEEGVFHEYTDQAGPSRSYNNVASTHNWGSQDLSTCDDDEDELQSSCSALTVATSTDHFVSLADSKQINTICSEHEKSSCTRSRTRLPSPMIPRDKVSIWSILKNCIGKDLSKITMPVVFNEPLTMLQRSVEVIQYSHFLKMADSSDDPIERMELVCAFIVAGLSANCHRIIKPFNPLLYETYEYDHELEDGSRVRGLAQQVSHHPPITAAYLESDNFVFNASVNPKIKFWGRSIEVQPDGQCRVYLKRHKESYLFKSVSCCVNNIIVGKLWFEHTGPIDIRCPETNIYANLLFKQAGWFSNDLHRFDGYIATTDEKGAEKKIKFIYGKWSDYIKTVDYAEYEAYLKESQQKLFRIPDAPDQSNGLDSMMDKLNLSIAQNSINNNIPISSKGRDSTPSSALPKLFNKSGDKKSNYSKSESIQSLDIPNSRTLWKLESQYLEEYYNFTLFTMKLNELPPNAESTLPKSDSRFRPDVRKLEEGDIDGAANEKHRLEEKQREARALDKRFKDPSADMLFFELKSFPDSKDKFWVYKGEYWESKCNSDGFPDLF